MKPGRELDIEVAKAMGWTNIQPNTDPPYGTHPNGTTAVIPYYSISWPDAAKAWEWLELFFRSVGYERPCLTEALDDEADRPSVVLRHRDEITETFTIGDTYPHAICLAVVKVAKGNEGTNA